MVASWRRGNTVALWLSMEDYKTKKPKARKKETKEDKNETHKENETRGKKYKKLIRFSMHLILNLIKNNKRKFQHSIFMKR